MTGECRRLRAVDVAAPLALLPGVAFRDTGGSNGHVAEPPWLEHFVAGLGLGRVTFCVLRKLPPYQGIPPHVDGADLSPVNVGHRYHVPLITHPLVTMRWPQTGAEHHLAAGWLYEVDYSRLHEVVHRAPVARIHIQVNALWQPAR